MNVFTLSYFFLFILQVLILIESKHSNSTNLKTFGAYQMALVISFLYKSRFRLIEVTMGNWNLMLNTFPFPHLLLCPSALNEIWTYKINTFAGNTIGNGSLWRAQISILSRNQWNLEVSRNWRIPMLWQGIKKTLI